MREISQVRALLIVLLAGVILAAGGFGVVAVAKRHWQWQPTFRVRAEFSRIGGLELGAKVRVQGMDAGTVESIIPPARPGLPVAVVLRIDAGLRGLVRSDATAQVGTQGVVGAKVVEVSPGVPNAPALADGGRIKTVEPPDLMDLMNDASKTLARLDSVAKSAEQGLGEITAIAGQIRAGQGTVGRLVHDDEAYRRVLSMSEHGEKALASLDENLAAMKRVWPISRYFNERGFNDRDRVLFQPSSEREARVLLGDDLFEPDRAVLTAKGRNGLDEWARWFLSKRHTKATEIVIAAFSDRPPDDEDLALLLTQEQAESVRRYLVSKYGIDSAGWFSSRKIAAVGFGSQTPKAYAEFSRGQPARRIEIILFTPQT